VTVPKKRPGKAQSRKAMLARRKALVPKLFRARPRSRSPGTLARSAPLSRLCVYSIDTTSVRQDRHS
jgi:hypothetical protein